MLEYSQAGEGLFASEAGLGFMELVKLFENTLNLLCLRWHEWRMASPVGITLQRTL
jgi:hypothetical protein